VFQQHIKNMHVSGIFQVEDIDDRTVELVTGMPVEQTRFVLTQFRKSNLMGVLHPVPFLTSLLRNFKDRVRQTSFAIASTQPIYYAPKAASLQVIFRWIFEFNFNICCFN